MSRAKASLCMSESVQMGLDTVELVMEVEEAFGISIPDDEAAGIFTVGDLYEFVLDRTRDLQRSDGVCLTAATFYAIRAGLNEVLGRNSRIRPRDHVHEILPQELRRDVWQALSKRLGLRLPRLSLPAWLDRVCWGFVFTASIACFFLAFFTVGLPLAMFAAIFSMCMSHVFLDFATRPFAVVPGTSIADFRGLTKNVMALNYETLSERFNIWTPVDVWIVLQTLIVDQLGVRSKVVTKDANIVSDLGAE